jgi:hypothetical protein
MDYVLFPVTKNLEDKIKKERRILKKERRR